MKLIEEYVNRIEEELEDAEFYAEKFVEYKAKGDMTTANRYKEMSNDELNHAMNIHSWAVAKIEKISAVYTPPPKMEERWTIAHKNFTHKMGEIKQMLAI